MNTVENTAEAVKDAITAADSELAADPGIAWRGALHRGSTDWPVVHLATELLTPAAGDVGRAVDDARAAYRRQTKRGSAEEKDGRTIDQWEAEALGNTYRRVGHLLTAVRNRTTSTGTDPDLRTGT